MTEIRAVLFDLDGTLLRVQMAEFIPRYIHGLAKYCADYTTPKKFEQAMLSAIRSLIRSVGDGEITNEQRLFSILQQQLALPETTLRQALESYRNDGLEELQPLVKSIPLATAIVNDCLRQNIPLVLATNPVFPEFMISARLKWAGLDGLPFDHLTSYENSCYCKPQPGYFKDIARLLGVAPEHCLMVGNDTQHDLAAVAVGMQTYLVDTWVIEREGASWPCEHRGDHLQLQQFLQQRLAAVG
ncbi:MAG TPA: HAD family hydrolase [Malonomonas sp.]